MRLPLLATTLLLLGAGRLPAQTPTHQVPSPQQIEQMQQAARQMMNPAAEILAHRTEFGLTAVQVSALQPLADQLNVSVDRMFARQGQLSPARERMMRAISDSTVVLDEAAIRAEACEQATQQADYTIAMVRAQQRIAGILTAAQREKFEELQVNRGMQMMQAFSGTAEKH